MLSKRAGMMEKTPLFVRMFLMKAIILFVVWKLLYHLVLVPARFPDKPLTKFTAISTAVFYQAVSGVETTLHERLSKEGHYNSAIMYVDGKKAIGIADPCNALELYVLYIGFLLCIPERFKKKLIYAVLGIIGIYVLNILRCAGIAWLSLHYISLADFAHHYAFKLVIYIGIFLMWIRFSRNYFKHVA